MAQIVYRANLSAAGFPLLSRQHGRTVIERQRDQNYVPNIASSESQDKGSGVPQAYYMHNVLPTYEGYASVGYMERVASPPAGAGFKDIFPIRGGDQQRAYVGISGNGKTYIFYSGLFTWLETSTGAGLVNPNTGLPGPLAQLSIANCVITHATVGGITYICFKELYKQAVVVKYHFVNMAWEQVALVGLDMWQLQGIFSSNGYLLSYTKTEVAWSSTVDVTDFTPDLATGAGGGAIEHLKGEVKFAAGTSHGFIVYSDVNAVAGAYSGNSRYPFNIREIPNTGGIQSSSDVAFEANSALHYAYTSSGLQAISVQKAEVVFPDITDFISGREFEDFNEETNQFAITLGQRMLRRLAYVSDRYLVISYGINVYTHALVIDTAHKRYGKLKVTHVKCFEWLDPARFGIEAAKEGIAFLQESGSVVSATKYSTTGGVLIAGKYQYIRQRLITLQGIEVESTTDFLLGFQFSLHVQTPVDDGLYGDFVEWTPTVERLRYKRYWNFQVGVNASILFKGNFELSSLVLIFTVNGRR